MICKIYYSDTNPNLYVLLEIDFTLDDYINSSQHQKDFIISKIEETIFQYLGIDIELGIVESCITHSVRGEDSPYPHLDIIFN